MSSTGRRGALAAAQVAVAAALVAALIAWLSPPWDTLRIELRPGYLAVGLLGTAAAALVTAARWKLLTEALAPMRMPLGAYLHALCLTRLLGQFLPAALVETVGRGAALKVAGSHHGLGRLLAPVVVERIFDLVLPLSIVGWAILVEIAAVPPVPTLVVAIATVSIASALMLRPLSHGAMATYAWLRRKLGRDPAVIDPPTVTTPLSVRVIALGVCRYIAVNLQFWGAGAGAGVLLPVLPFVGAAAAAQLGALVGLTPGGWGLVEGGWAGGLTHYGIDAAAIVVFMAATRMMMLVGFGALTVLTLPWRRPPGLAPARGSD